jgi:hypothetical protein
MLGLILRKKVWDLQNPVHLLFPNEAYEAPVLESFLLGQHLCFLLGISTLFSKSKDSKTPFIAP